MGEKLKIKKPSLRASSWNGSGDWLKDTGKLIVAVGSITLASAGIKAFSDATS